MIVQCDATAVEWGIGSEARESCMIFGRAIARRANPRRIAMKTMVTTLIALSVFGLVASAPARAFDAKAFYEQLDRSRT